MKTNLEKSVEFEPVALQRTPRQNRDLPQRLGDFATITEALDYAARGVTGFNFYSGRGVLEHVVSFADLRMRSLQTARKLLALGLQRGDRVAVVADTSPDFMTVFFGCQYAGLVPCPMPYSMYIGGKNAYVARITGMLKAAHANAVIAASDVLEPLSIAATAAGIDCVISHEALAEQPESFAKLQSFTADEIAYIQYSSGSTSEPKGVLVTQHSISSNANVILHGMAIVPEDRAFSWLPLYHDMGLVGFCLAPMFGQVTTDYLSTSSFARRPALWLRLMSQNRSTCSSAPTFGYELAGRRINGEAQDLDLSGLRVACIGGDMVRPDVLNNFSEILKPAGFNPTAFAPSYGMAEATLAISISDTAKPMRVDVIDRDAMKHQGKAISVAQSDKSRSFVVCGAPLRGHTVQVRKEDGIVCDERDIGRIFVKGPSLTAGYYEQAEATVATFGADGYLDTGDMGYLLDGEIVITGRAKDLILHNGRNIWPQDIEWAAEQADGLGAGDVAAFAVEGQDGDDEVVILVQCRKQDAVGREALLRDVSRLVHESAGSDCTIVLVPPKSLPFTSSGKLSRAGARAKYLAGELSGGDAA